MKCRATSTFIDQAKADTFVLSFFEDERPLKGMAGLVDWRLCGSLSRFILQDYIDGEFGEQLLFPVGHQLQCKKILLVGLGPRKSYDFESYSVCLRKICDAMFKLHVNDFALSLPGLDRSDIDVKMAATRFCEALGNRYRENKGLLSTMTATIVALPDHLKKINPILAGFEKRTRDELGL